MRNVKEEQFQMQLAETRREVREVKAEMRYRAKIGRTEDVLRNERSNQDARQSKEVPERE